MATIVVVHRLAVKLAGGDPKLNEDDQELNKGDAEVKKGDPEMKKMLHKANASGRLQRHVQKATKLSESLTKWIEYNYNISTFWLVTSIIAFCLSLG